MAVPPSRPGQVGRQADIGARNALRCTMEPAGPGGSLPRLVAATPAGCERRGASNPSKPISTGVARLGTVCSVNRTVDWPDWAHLASGGGMDGGDMERTRRSLRTGRQLGKLRGPSSSSMTIRQAYRLTAFAWMFWLTLMVVSPTGGIEVKVGAGDEE